MRLDQQIAVVSGGASGLGKACVERLIAEGVRVAVWDKQTEPGYITDSVLGIGCDLSSAEQAEMALKQTIQELGIPRICINCAGIAPAERLFNREGPASLDLFKKVLDINLVGTFNVMRLVSEAMSTLELDQEGQERGVIINTASVAAYEGQLGQLAYSASKGGVVSMTLPAARELADYAIRVNTIAPGLFATPLLLSMPQKVQDSLVETLTFPKRFGKAEEFANLAIHIIENSMINGEVIRLDGALRMQSR